MNKSITLGGHCGQGLGSTQGGSVMEKGNSPASCPKMGGNYKVYFILLKLNMKASLGHPGQTWKPVAGFVLSFGFRR